MNDKEICWNITTRCNQACKYCHRFLNIQELSLDDNLKILDNLHKCNITSITWTGGEALLYSGLDILIEQWYKFGIKNKIITNAKLLNNKRLIKLIPFLSNITLSLDTINNDLNTKIGRGTDHFSNVNNVLNYIKENEIIIDVSINTVLSKVNIHNNEDLIKYLNDYKITNWRIFKFMPLRELAIHNNKLFIINNEDYFKEIEYIKSKSNIKKIETRIENEMERSYLLILADGSITITKDGVDTWFGNAIRDNISDFLWKV